MKDITIRCFFSIPKKIMVVTFFLSVAFSEACSQNIKIIEFGWDYPDIYELSNRLDSMQNTPFDGICFSFQKNIMEAFDTSLKSESYFEFKRLQTLEWGKYSSNFIILRGFSKAGGNWFDDKAWKNISDNMINLSRAMQMQNIAGILFDPEYYYEDELFNPWTFSSKQYPGKTLLQVQNQVKQRGKQFIIALQKRKSSFTFISLWIASLIAQEKKYTPLKETRHVLLMSFIEGILEKKNKNVVIADGNEYAYWNTKPSQFFEAKSLLKNTLVELLNSGKSKKEAKNIQIAQPVYYDGLMGTNTPFGKNLKRDIKWKWLDENLKYALASSDSFMWFYSERYNWWRGHQNDTLLTMLKRDKISFNKFSRQGDNYSSSGLKRISINNFNSKKGYYIDTTTIKNEPAFNYNWNQNSKNLSLNFCKKKPLSTFIYINNILQKNFRPSKLNLTVSLPAFTKGHLVIINKYENEKESSAIYILKK